MVPSVAIAVLGLFGASAAAVISLAIEDGPTRNPLRYTRGEFNASVRFVAIMFLAFGLLIGKHLL